MSVPLNTRRFCRFLFFAAVLTASLLVLGQSLGVRVDGERLRIDITKARLLVGEPLERLHDGASVTYIVQVSALTARSGSVLTRTTYRYVISYDIFEERFQVSRIQPAPRVLSHLSMAAAEAAMVDSLEIPASSIPPDRPFWIRWEYQVEDPSQSADGGMSLGTLVDVFSRKASKGPVGGASESGPFRLRELPRVAPARGASNP